jgi:hypothetical protein
MVAGDSTAGEEAGGASMSDAGTVAGHPQAYRAADHAPAGGPAAEPGADGSGPWHGYGSETGADRDQNGPAAGEALGRAPAIRPFLLTAGRVASAAQVPPIPLETQVVATAKGLAALRTLAFEHHDIVTECRLPQSLAEVAARLRLHLNVVRVLADDLRAGGQLAVHVPNARTAQDISVLRRVIDGLRAVPDSQGVRRDNRHA